MKAPLIVVALSFFVAFAHGVTYPAACVAPLKATTLACGLNNASTPHFSSGCTEACFTSLKAAVEGCKVGITQAPGAFISEPQVAFLLWWAQEVLGNCTAAQRAKRVWDTCDSTAAAQECLESYVACMEGDDKCACAISIGNSSCFQDCPTGGNTFFASLVCQSAAARGCIKTDEPINCAVSSLFPTPEPAPNPAPEPTPSEPAPTPSEPAPALPPLPDLPPSPSYSPAPTTSSASHSAASLVAAAVAAACLFL